MRKEGVKESICAIIIAGLLVLGFYQMMNQPITGTDKHGKYNENELGREYK